MKFKVMEQVFKENEVDVRQILANVPHQKAVIHAEALNKSHQANPSSGVRVYYVDTMTRGAKNNG